MCCGIKIIKEFIINETGNKKDCYRFIKGNVYKAEIAGGVLIRFWIDDKFTKFYIYENVKNNIVVI